MKNKIIQLSKKLVFTNVDDAKAYQVENWYTQVFRELDTQMDFVGIRPGQTVNLPTRIELQKAIAKIYEPRFGNVFVNSKPVKDLNDYQLDLELIILNVQTFEKGKYEGLLHVHLVTKPLELVESLGHLLLFKKPLTQETTDLISIELDSYTTIYSIKDIENG